MLSRAEAWDSGPVVATVFQAHGYEIDVDLLYRAMHQQSVMEQGKRVFHGNSRRVKSVKRLLTDLFDVPTDGAVHPVSNAIRKRAEERLAELGWAAKDPGHSARYTLHREL